MQMEVTRVLLLFAATMLLAPVLGQTEIRKPKNIDLVRDVLLERRQAPVIQKVLLNVNRPPLVRQPLTALDELDALLATPSCRRCAHCALRAIAAHDHVKTAQLPPHHIDLDSDLLAEFNSLRAPKRLAREAYPALKYNKKAKLRKDKIRKRITVTKYNMNNKVLAIKVREVTQQGEYKFDQCQLYTVSRMTSCNSSDRAFILGRRKKKVNKRPNWNGKKKLRKPPPPPRTRGRANNADTVGDGPIGNDIDAEQRLD